MSKLQRILVAMADEVSLAELAGDTGVPERTIRFYIARGLSDGPVKAGRDGGLHIRAPQAAEKIKRLQAGGGRWWQSRACSRPDPGPNGRR